MRQCLQVFQKNNTWVRQSLKNFLLQMTCLALNPVLTSIWAGWVHSQLYKPNTRKTGHNLQLPLGSLRLKGLLQAPPTVPKRPKKIGLAPCKKELLLLVPGQEPPTSTFPTPAYRSELPALPMTNICKAKKKNMYRTDYKLWLKNKHMWGKNKLGSCQK